MIANDKFQKHYQESLTVSAKPSEIFAFADNHHNFSSHMNQSSWMMLGGKMETNTDEGKGQKLGSHITMSGNILGRKLFLDEVITRHQPLYFKEWQTVGEINLLVVDHYKLGFEIKPDDQKSIITVFIYYNLPKVGISKLLGQVFGGMYARWCVRQMLNGIKNHFNQIY